MKKIILFLGLTGAAALLIAATNLVPQQVTLTADTNGVIRFPTNLSIGTLTIKTNLTAPSATITNAMNAGSLVTTGDVVAAGLVRGTNGFSASDGSAGGSFTNVLYGHDEAGTGSVTNRLIFKNGLFVGAVSNDVTIYP